MRIGKSPDAPIDSADRWDDNELYQKGQKSGLFTPGELGVPDGDEGRADRSDVLGVQGGRGPLDQEGEGNRQNSELAELEADVDAKDDLERRR